MIAIAQNFDRSDNIKMIFQYDCANYYSFQNAKRRWRQINYRELSKRIEEIENIKFGIGLFLQAGKEIQGGYGACERRLLIFHFYET